MSIIFFGIIVWVVLALLHLYSAIAFYCIAKRTKTKFAWLAFIPVINIILLPLIGRVNPATLLLLFCGGIPVLGPVILFGTMGYWFWKIAEVRKRPGIVGLLLFIPVVNVVVLGILAWSKK